MKIENQIEKDLITKLIDLKYTYRQDIRDRSSLEENFRKKFQELNKVQLSDNEFLRLKESIISSDIYTASQTLRSRNTFEREDGTPLHYTLVNTKDWCKNTFEVVNQLRINTENSHQRYDVILLINGVPVVQIELKTLTISPKRAMQQIVDYKNEIGNGYTNTLLCFMQLFIVSNRSETLYFANNNNCHFSFNAEERFLPIYQFADEKNKKITYLENFAEKFLAKCTLGEMISQYMVLIATEQKLMMMRPYQIYAVKAIVDCIHQNRGNGYIWHTTGSGKTLTSFKASTLLKDNPDIEKCLFVVDRKDLDKQTREEFNKFQEGCVEENTNTESLVQRLLSDDYAHKVLVTTIQKLGLALDETNKRNYKKRLESLKNSRIVFIFDECHRSQFGENHKAIKEFFPNAQMFGFTGTPIFEKNANYKELNGDEGSFKTTEDIFEKQLHAYTITHAIDDHNVLKFHIDYFKPEDDNAQKKGENLRKKAITDSILNKHNAVTAGRKFNAFLATARINDAIEYYKLFKEIQTNSSKPLNIACVFSPPSEGNKDIQQIQEDLPQEKLDNQEAPEEKKAVLREIIADYNNQYKTNHEINKFDLYYQDVQKRIKDQKYNNQDYPHENKIDLVIVVDMLLTGFDSKYLNTLYVDKNLKHHGLIQAFSRTNRILNDTKPYGNILDFRGQQAEVDEAIALFSGEKGEKAKEIWLVDPAPVVIEKLDKAVSTLEQFMESQGLSCEPQDVANLKGDEARARFVTLFKEVQKLKTQLDQYTDLTEDSSQRIEEIIPPYELQAFRGVYLDTAQRLKAQQKKWEEIPEEVEQLDFEFVLFASATIDYDYIMNLITNYAQDLPSKQKITRDELVGILCSDAKLMDDKEDIIAYIDTLKTGKSLTQDEVVKGFEAFKKKKITIEIVKIATDHGLDPKFLQNFIDGIMRRMIFDGEVLTDLLKPLDLGWQDRVKKEEALMQDLIPLLHKLSNGQEISGLRVYEE